MIKIKGEQFMAEKHLNTRIVHKHDYEVNWLKATNFVPMQGEIVVYDSEVDENGNIVQISDGNGGKIAALPTGRTVPYTYERFKIGDGITLVSDLPFASESYDDSEALIMTLDIPEDNYEVTFGNLGDNIYVVWGDTIQAPQATTLKHEYKKAGTYTCKIFNVKLIYDGAVNSKSFLTSVIIPKCVVAIDRNAFASCINLTSVKIADGVTNIGYGAFYCCSSLTDIDIPDSVTSIGDQAFAGCSSLNTATIGKNVSTVDSDTFNACAGLTKVVFKPTDPACIDSMVWKMLYYDAVGSIIVPHGCGEDYRTTFGNLDKKEVLAKLDLITEAECSSEEELSYTGITSGTGDFSIQQGGGQLSVTGDHSSAFGFGGVYRVPNTEDYSIRKKTYNVLKTLSNLGEPVYFEFVDATKGQYVKYNIVLKNSENDCVNLYDAYVNLAGGYVRILTNIDGREFTKGSLFDCYTYIGKNAGKASLTAGAKYYNNAKYSLLAGTQNVLGDTSEDTYNDLVYGSFNTVIKEKNSLVGGSCNIVNDGQLNQISGFENTVTKTHNSVISGKWNKTTELDESIVVGHNLVASGNIKAVFGKYNEDNANALLIVGNGESDNMQKNAFEVLKDGKAKVYGDLEVTGDVKIKGTSISNMTGASTDADVKLSGPFTLTQDFGYYTLDGAASKSFGTAGQSLHAFLQGAFASEDSTIFENEPSFGISISGSRSGEIGSTVKPTASWNNQAGSYKWGTMNGTTPDYDDKSTGITYTQTAAISATAGTLNTDHTFTKDTYTVSVKGGSKRSAVTKHPISNIGTDLYSELDDEYKSETTDNNITATAYFTGYRKMFMGATSSADDITGTLIRSWFNSSSSTSFKAQALTNKQVTAAATDRKIIWAIPSSFKVKSIKFEYEYVANDWRTLSTDGIATPLTVKVPGAGTDEGENYTVYVCAPSVAGAQFGGSGFKTRITITQQA
jgi:hypothetical protein